MKPTDPRPNTAAPNINPNTPPLQLPLLNVVDTHTTNPT
jgi:hypothetical protein